MMEEYFSSSSQNSMDEFCHYWEECASAATSSSSSAQERFLQTREFGPEGESRGYADDATWILTASFVILTMQSGFGLLEAGSCSQGYEVNIMMKNIVDVAFGSLAYYLVGYGISFGQPSIPFMGLGSMPAVGGFDEVESGLLYSRYIFQLSFAATSTTIVSGCVAQRLRFFVYVVYSFFSVAFYSFCAHWVFDTGGWLNMMGVHDFAGAGPVHLFGAVNGLVGILFVGSRTGRFDQTRPISDFFPSSPLSQCMGLFMLMWGWIGFNCGSTFGITDDRWTVAIRVGVTTINSTVGGIIASIAYSMWRTNWTMVIPEHVINGVLASLVASSAACASVRTYVAFAVGSIGALCGLTANTIICRMKLDDPVGGIGHHGVSAIWGLIAVGLFADSRLPGIEVEDGLFNGGGFELLGLQLLEVVAIIGWSLMWATSFFYISGVIVSRDWKNPRKGLRVSDLENVRGADWFLHGVVDMEAVAEELDFSLSHMLENDDSGSSRKKRSSHVIDPALLRSTSFQTGGSEMLSGSGKTSTRLSDVAIASSAVDPALLRSTSLQPGSQMLSGSGRTSTRLSDFSIASSASRNSSSMMKERLTSGLGPLPPVEEDVGSTDDLSDSEEQKSTTEHDEENPPPPPSSLSSPQQGHHHENGEETEHNYNSQVDAIIPRVGIRSLLAEARMDSSHRLLMLQRQLSGGGGGGVLDSMIQQQRSQRRAFENNPNRRQMLKRDCSVRHLAQMYR